jgi:hypothetical protein
LKKTEQNRLRLRGEIGAVFEPGNNPIVQGCADRGGGGLPRLLCGLCGGGDFFVCLFVFDRGD